MMKPGMLPPGMQRMPYPQPSAPQAPLPPYLQALLGGLPQGAMGLPMQAMQNPPGMMPAPQVAASGLQPMGQGGGMMPAPLEAASIAPQSGPFRPFSFLGAPSRAMSYR